MVACYLFAVAKDCLCLVVVACFEVFPSNSVGSLHFFLVWFSLLSCVCFVNDSACYLMLGLISWWFVFDLGLWFIGLLFWVRIWFIVGFDWCCANGWTCLGCNCYRCGFVVYIVLDVLYCCGLCLLVGLLFLFNSVVIVSSLY